MSVLDLWIRMGKLYEHIGEHTQAVTCYLKGVGDDQDRNLAIYEAVGHTYRRYGVYGLAIHYYRMYLLYKPENILLWKILGHCYLLTGDFANTCYCYEQALERRAGKFDVDLWFAIGMCFDKFKKTRLAIDVFTRLLQSEALLGNKRKDVIFRLGVLHSEVNEPESALKYFQSILDNPSSTLTRGDIQYHIGMVYERMGDFDRALFLFSQVVNSYPAHTLALVRLGALVQQQPNLQPSSLQNSISQLRRACRFDERSETPWYLQAKVFFRLKKADLAHQAACQCIARNRNHIACWLLLGDIYSTAGQLRDAFTAYKQVIIINPMTRDAWQKIGNLYSSCGLPKDAAGALNISTYLSRQAASPAE